MAKKKEIESFKIPRYVQDVIPVKVLYKDGMAYMGDGIYTKMFALKDINYSAASGDSKEIMHKLYMECLNTFEVGQQTKITVINRKLLRDEIEEQFRMKLKGDKYDVYRKEHNEIIEGKLDEINNLRQEKYITASCEKRDEDSAKSYFLKCEKELSAAFRKLGSGITALNADERLKIYHDFYRPGEEEQYVYSIKNAVKLGHDFKDYIAPDGISVKDDYLKIGDKFTRVLYVKDYPNAKIYDETIEKLTGLSNNVILSLDIYPVSVEEAQKRVSRIMDGIDTDITRWQQNQTRHSVVPFDIPYQFKTQKRGIQSFADDLGSANQMMMCVCITLVHMADTLEKLEDDTHEIINSASGVGLTMAKIKFQQIQALNTVLPFGGLRRFAPVRTLTTREVAGFMPFSVQNLQQKDGIYLGENAISNDLISINIWSYNSYNSYVIGSTGSGKSFLTKEIIVQNFLTNPDIDIIIIDPDAEYAEVVKALDGTVVNISSTSQTRINPLDISVYYGDDEEPVTVKAEFVLSLCEQIIGSANMNARKKSIISRCVQNIFRPYVNAGFKGTPPTMLDLYNEIKRQPEPEAATTALELELFVVGSLNVFATQSNVNINNRVTCYNIRSMSEQLRPAGMLIVLDNIWNRITRNRENGRLTYIFIDEISLLFGHEYSAQYLSRLWRRVRKYGAGCCGILQNASDFGLSESARVTIKNSQFVIIMNQHSDESDNLYTLFQVSPEQLEYVTNVTYGKGLIYINETGALVPFSNSYPKDSELYKMISTRPRE
ncbi:MAG: ATP-binding protein [Butyrivibrio sp.]|uniref:VirB4-like conjugal transfer ATPase, CD1110 family n=1 Tax=Butyrivibrio sp. TaxID=28121 RepID=UPI001B2D3902|nr:DUF87 domain-containing protein [Butyrivibrio sp.]MBO6239498.1 ATP-binding protein [Butyrivibrio sp.]MBP3239103.1 ATP-binding protein [Oribacterium sp.]